MFTLLERIIIDIAALIVIMTACGVVLVFLYKDGLNSAIDAMDGEDCMDDYLKKGDNSVE